MAMRLYVVHRRYRRIRELVGTVRREGQLTPRLIQSAKAYHAIGEDTGRPRRIAMADKESPGRQLAGR